MDNDIVENQNNKLGNRTLHVRNNFVWEMIFNIVTTFGGFLIRSLMIRKLGADMLGLNSLMLSICSTLNVISLGANTAFLGVMYAPYANGNIDEVNELFSLYKVIWRLFGNIILIAGVLFTPFLHMFVENNVSASVNIYFIYYSFIISQWLTYETTFFENAIFILDQRWDIYLKIVISQNVFLYLFQSIAIIMRNYYLCAFLQIPLTIFAAMLFHANYKKKYVKYCYNSAIKKNTKKYLWKKMLSISVYYLRDSSRNTFDSLVISRYLGIVQLAYYQNYNMVLNIPILLRGMISRSLVGSLGNYYASEGKEKLYSYYKHLLFVELFLSGWFGVFFFFIIDSFISIWVGAESILPYPCIMIMVIYMYCMSFVDVFGVFRNVTAEWSNGYVAIIEAFSNLALNIILAKFFGMFGIVLATVVTLLLIYVPNETKVLLSTFFQKPGFDSVKIVLKNAIWTIISASSIAIIMRLIPNMHIIKLIIALIICIIIPLFFSVIIYYKDEEYNYLIMIGRELVVSAIRNGKNRCCDRQ